jgi:hypothetical protein
MQFLKFLPNFVNNRSGRASQSTEPRMFRDSESRAKQQTTDQKTERRHTMKTTKHILALLALGSSAVLAVDSAKPALSGAELLKQLDKNHDGTVSLEEFKAGPMNMKEPLKAEENFKKQDRNHDGKLNAEELAPAIQSQTSTTAPITPAAPTAPIAPTAPAAKETTRPDAGAKSGTTAKPLDAGKPLDGTAKPQSK